jgi:hypothetical protein
VAACLTQRFFPGDHGADGARHEEAPPPPDFTDYLRQTRLWHDVLRMPEERRQKGADAAWSPRAHGDKPGGDVLIRRSCSAEAAQRPMHDIEHVVPPIFFDPAFDVTDTTMFLRACPLDMESESHLAAKLTDHLDLVCTTAALSLLYVARDSYE